MSARRPSGCSSPGSAGMGRGGRGCARYSRSYGTSALFAMSRRHIISRNLITLQPEPPRSMGGNLPRRLFRMARSWCSYRASASDARYLRVPERDAREICEVTDAVPSDFACSPYTGWVRGHYEAVAAELGRGFLQHRTAGHSGGIYPGRASKHGAQCDSMEAFSRLLPLVGSWLADSSRPGIISYEGTFIDLH